MTHFPFPFAFDRRGRTAGVDEPAHVRQMIEQLLFTNPGERLNRPDFGSGLLQLVHSPNSEVLAATLEAGVHGALERWLGDVLEVHNLQVESIDNRLVVELTYSLLRTQELRTEKFERSGL